MNIEGTYTLQAPPEVVWQCLVNREVLLHIIPGIEQLEHIDNHSSSFSLHIKQAPLTGAYSGRVTAVEQDAPSSCLLTITDEGIQRGHHNIQGSGEIRLHKREDHTIITYKATLSFGKPGMRLSPLVKGTAKMLMQQFFSALSHYLHSSSYTETLTEEELVGATVIKQSAGNIVVMPQVLSSLNGGKPSFSHTLVRMFRLGADDPVQQELWVRRVKRAGFISFMLLLVWIGTRLPRRRVTSTSEL